MKVLEGLDPSFAQWFVGFVDAEFILQNKHYSPKELKTIASLQNTINSQRIEYDLPSNHSIRITSSSLIDLV